MSSASINSSPDSDTATISGGLRWHGGGILVLAAAAVAFAVGVLRSEPVSLLFGGAILALGLYVALVGLLGVTVLRGRTRRSGAAVQLRTEPSEVPAGSGFRLRGSVTVPMPFLPGFVRSVRAELRGPGDRSLDLELPLRRRGEVEVDRLVPAPRRGLYHSGVVSFRLRDLLGFSAGWVLLPVDLYVRVLPISEEPEVSPRHGRNVGGERARSTTRRRTDELLETRRYVPGDDTRRINWNMYARWGELLVRIGEEVPPPRAQHHCVLYTGAPRRIARAAPTRMGSVPARAGRKEETRRRTAGADRLLDRAVALFAGYCHALSRSGAGVVATIRDGAATNVELTAGEEHALLRRLAESWWIDPGAVHRVATSEVGTLERGEAAGPLRGVSVFAAPGAEGLEDYLHELGCHVKSMDVFLVDQPREPETARPPLLQRLIFVDHTPAAVGLAEGPEDAEDARAALRHRLGGAHRVEIV